MAIPSQTDNKSSPSQQIRPTFVDGLWIHLEAAIRPEVERRLATFLRRQKATKWIIAADFCIRDQFRPNDSFAFVLLPAGERFRQTTSLLNELPSFDLKDARSIPRSLKKALTDGRVFTLCFVADRERRLYADASVVRYCLDQTIELMERWENANDCKTTIESVRAMRAEASKASVNLRLIEDVTVTAALSAAIAIAICRFNPQPVEQIGWAPDRDKITESYSGIAATLFNVNVAALCDRHGLPHPAIGIFTQTSENPWCDPMIRLADYVAGIAAWDPPAADKVPSKIAELIKDIFADNRRLALFRLAFRAAGTHESRIRISQVKITKAKPEGRPRERQKLIPLRGSSRSL